MVIILKKIGQGNLQLLQVILKTKLTLMELSNSLGISLVEETNLFNLDYRYTSHLIPKKYSHEYRKIRAPNNSLKEAQEKVLNYLSSVLEIRSSRHSHGYIKNKSIFTNARVHKNQAFVLNIDIKNFFGSIHYGRIFALLEKKGFNRQCARAITSVICDKESDNSLPMGSPLSPFIANIFGDMIDKKVKKFLDSIAQHHQIKYTRYVDDLTFSSSDMVDLSHLIADKSSKKLAEKLLCAIEGAGFKLNPTKTRLMLKSKSQVVTGLVVNNKVSAPLKYRSLTRQMCYKFLKEGEIYYRGEVIKESNRALKILLGCYNFIYQAHLSNEKVLDVDTDFYKSYFYKSYKQLLFIDRFLSVQKIQVIGEGKTDAQHLNLAKKLLRKSFFNIYEPSKLCQYIFSLHTEDDKGGKNGGTDALKNFIKSYKEIIEEFSPKQKKDDNRHHKYGYVRQLIEVSKPVIILFDADDGAKSICAYIKQNIVTTQSKINPEGYYRICANLYVLFLPKINDKPTAIENLYQNSSIDKQLSNKSIDKCKFVEAVKVSPSNFNFDKFKDLFSLFKEIQKDLTEIRKSKEF